MKSWHVTTRYNQADVIYFRGRYVCLDCDSEHCNDVHWVISFRSRPDVVAQWEGLSVREDINNPAVIRKVQESPASSRVRQYIAGQFVRQDVCEPPRTQQAQSLEDRVRDLIRRVHSYEEVIGLLPRTEQETPETPESPEPPAQTTPFDLIEL